MEKTILDVLGSVITLLLTAILSLGFELIRRKLGEVKFKKITGELDTKKELANLAVQFAEQAFQDLKGPDKYNKAAEWLAEQFKKHGLQITDTEIKGLIEAALKTVKDTTTAEINKPLLK